MSIWVKCDVSAGGALTERGRVKAVGRPGDGTRNTIKGMARSSGTTLRAGIFSGGAKWISPPLAPPEAISPFQDRAAAVGGREPRSSGFTPTFGSKGRAAGGSPAGSQPKQVARPDLPDLPDKASCGMRRSRSVKLESPPRVGQLVRVGCGEPLRRAKRPSNAARCLRWPGVSLG